MSESKEVSIAMKIKMLVQTMYRGELLRAGKVYEINEETAQKWLVSKMAEEVNEEQKAD